MDKKVDMMNPDGFSRFNGPIFTLNLLLWVWYGVWPQVEPIHVLVVICDYFYPARACASKGLCDRSWRLYIVVVYCILYIVYKSALFFGTNLLSPKILTFRGLF